ncbi:hypothetical protein [Flavobacterium rhizosphaerae]|uniref:DUF3575 domain-containing protein n=1 Tax=Flavobacterium rhizosphaerae TaxID=3163298 RepID=A0ABW8YY96_9FLAO
MKKTALSLLMFCVFTVMSAQEITRDESESVLTFSLFTPTFSYAPRYKVGFMHKISSRWWAGLSAGYGNYDTSFNFTRNDDNNIVNKDYKLYEVRPEIYYDLRPTSKLKHLLSAELFYIHHTDVFYNDRYNENIYTYKYTTADYRRIKTGLNINYNLLFYFTKKLGLTLTTGLGVKFRNVNFNNVTGKTEVDISGDDEGNLGLFEIDGYRKEAGNDTNINFNFDLKLFYKF